MNRKFNYIVLDMPILICILLFLTMSIMSFNDQMGFSIFAFFVSAGLIISYIATLLMRRKVARLERMEKS